MGKRTRKRTPKERAKAPKERAKASKERTKASINTVLREIDKLEHRVRDLAAARTPKPPPPELSEAEGQMILSIREQTGSDDYRLNVERRDGAWDITMSIAPHDKDRTSRGTGRTFDEAWGNMAPLWHER